MTNHNVGENYVTFFKTNGHTHDGEDSSLIDLSKYDEVILEPIRERIIQTINIDGASGPVVIDGYEIRGESPAPTGLSLSTGSIINNYEQVYVDVSWDPPPGRDFDEDIQNDNFDDSNPNDYADQVSEYEVRLYTTGNLSEVLTQRTKQTNIRFIPVLPNTGYTVELRSVNYINVLSNPVTDTITSAVDTTPPGQVQNLTSVNGYEMGTLLWDALADADVVNNRGFYQLQIDDTSSAFGSIIRDRQVAATLAIIAGLTVGQTYYARVRGVDSSGNTGPWSLTESFTPQPVSNFEGLSASDFLRSNVSDSYTGDTLTFDSTAELRLDNANDASLSSTDHAFQIGPTSGVNIAFDGDEIVARNNGVASTLSLNSDGGQVIVGGGGLEVGGDFNQTAGTTTVLRVLTGQGGTSANPLNVYGGTSDHVYVGYYPDAAAQGTRQAYHGFGGPGTSTFTLKNEISGGTIDLTTTGGGSIRLDTGFVQIPTGGAQGTPTLFFQGDTNTGIYQSSVDTISMSTAGTRRFHLTDSVLEMPSTHSLSLGSTSPQGTLDLGSATSGRSIVWGGTSGTAHYASIGTDYSSADLILVDGAKLRTTATGLEEAHTATYGICGVRFDRSTGDVNIFTSSSAARTKDTGFDDGTATALTLSGSGLATFKRGSVGVTQDVASIYLGSSPTSGDRLRLLRSGSNSYIDFGANALYIRDKGTTTLAQFGPGNQVTMQSPLYANDKISLDHNGGTDPGTFNSLLVDADFSIATTGTTYQKAGDFNVSANINSGITNSGYAMGANIAGYLNGPGTLAQSIGIRADAGTAASGTGTVTDAYALYARVLNSGAGTITTGYGLYVADVAATTGYGVYQAGSNDSNYFAGKVTANGRLLAVDRAHFGANEATSGQVRIETSVSTRPALELKAAASQTADMLIVMDDVGTATFTIHSDGKVTATDFVTLHADPTANLHAATKQYVDAQVGGGSGDAGTLDGLDSTQFLRSDADDTFTGDILDFDGAAINDFTLSWGTEDAKQSVIPGFFHNDLSNWELRGGAVTETPTNANTSGTLSNIYSPGTGGDETRNYEPTAAGANVALEFSGINFNARSHALGFVAYLVSRAGNRPTEIKFEVKDGSDVWQLVVNDTSPTWNGNVWRSPQVPSMTLPHKEVRFTFTWDAPGGIWYLAEVGYTHTNAPMGVHAIPFVNKSNTFYAPLAVSSGSYTYSLQSNKFIVDVGNTATPATAISVENDSGVHGEIRVGPGLQLYSAAGAAMTMQHVTSGQKINILTTNGEIDINSGTSTIRLDGNVLVDVGHTLTLDSDPTANLHAATKQYVDAQVGGGTGDCGTIDGLDSSQFLRSDVADTFEGILTGADGIHLQTSAGGYLEVYQSTGQTGYKSQLRYNTLEFTRNTSNYFTASTAGGDFVWRVNGSTTNRMKLRTDGIMELMDAAGTVTIKIDPVNDRIDLGADVNLYRSTANFLKTDDSFLVGDGFKVDQPNIRAMIGPNATQFGSCTLSVGTYSTDRENIILRGNASQTADMTQWQNSVGTVLAYIDSSGGLSVQKAGFNGTAPINQPAAIANVAGTGGDVEDEDARGKIDQILQVLRDYGLIAT